MVDVIGRRVRRLRLERGLSLRALAKCSGVTLSAISGVEVGTRGGLNLTAHTCIRLARALGVTADALMSLEEDGAAEPPVARAVA